MPFTVDLVAVPKAVPVVRRMLRARFAGADTTDLTLCVGELLTNVIVHLGEGAPVTLRVSGTHTGLIRAELSDPVPGVWPVHRSAGAGDESGRGCCSWTRWRCGGAWSGGCTGRRSGASCGRPSARVRGCGYWELSAMWAWRMRPG